MLAVSQDLPIRCFAVSAQKHPYAFFSLAKNPVRTPADLRGKKVGIQATGVDPAARAAGEEQHRPEGRAGRHHRLGHDADHDRAGGRRDRLADQHHRAEGARAGPRRRCGCGMPACSSTPIPYYATPETHRRSKATCWPRFLRAARRGWGYRLRQPRQGGRTAGQAISQPGRRGRARRGRRDARLHASTTHTKAGGYGTMDPAVWQEQIDLYASLGQFTKRTPKRRRGHDARRSSNATADSRPKIG